MATHIKIVAILHIVFGALSVLAGLVLMIIFGGLAGLVGSVASDVGATIAVPILGGIASLLGIVFLALGIPGIVAGIGLLEFRPWGRILGIIISALDLMHVPFGTALGIYGLWALLSREGEQLFANPPRQPVRV